MLLQVSEDLKKHLPKELVSFLFSSYREIKENYLLMRHEPAELNGGKFVEACFRIIEHITSGTYTPVGNQTNDMIGKLRLFEKLPSNNFNESFRIHIPRTLATIYNIRNKRGVGHLSGDVNPNFVDSTLIISCADWTLAELLRTYYSCSLEEAQGIVNELVARPSFLIHEIDDIKRVLNPNLSQRNQVLVLLASEYPKSVSDVVLIEWIEPKNKSAFISSILRTLHSERLIEYKQNKNCLISPTGLRYVDINHESFLNQI